MGYLSFKSILGLDKFRYTASPYPIETLCSTVRALFPTTDALCITATSVMVALCGAVGKWVPWERVRLGNGGSDDFSVSMTSFA